MALTKSSGGSGTQAKYETSRAQFGQTAESNSGPARVLRSPNQPGWLLLILAAAGGSDEAGAPSEFHQLVNA